MRTLKMHIPVVMLVLAVAAALVFCELRIALTDAAAEEDAGEGKITLKNVTGAVVREAWNSDDEAVFIYRSGGKKMRILLKTDYIGETLEGEIIDAGSACVTVTAKLSSTAGNFGEFDYRKYLLCHNIEYVAYPSYKNITAGGGESGLYYFFMAGPETLFSRVRGAIESAIEKYLGKEYSGYVMSVMTGYKGGLSSDETENLALAGFSHLAAVSGSHLAFVMKPFEAVIKRLPIKITKRKVILLIPGVLLWIAAGMSPSVTRALLTLAAGTFAMVLKRPENKVNSLSIAAVLQICVNPYVIYNTGFELSYGAAFSIALILPALKKIFKTKAPIADSVIAGVAVNLGLIPVMIYMFGGFSLLGILLNAFAAKAAGVLCTGGYLVFFMSLIHLPDSVIAPVARVMRGCGLFFAEGVNRVAEYESFPFRVESASLPLWFTLFYYILVVWLCIGTKFTAPAILSLASTVLVFAVPWQTGAVISYIDVGQANCALIKTSDGVCGLVDTGDGTTDIAAILKKKGIRKLDFVLITHGHSDHYGGLADLSAEIPIDVLFLPLNTGDSYCTDMAANCDFAEVVTVDQYYSVDIGGYNRLTMYESAYNTAADDENNGSVIAVISGKWGNAIIPGDAENEELNEIMSRVSFEKCNILQLPHHGSASSANEKFLCETDPDYVIISVGKNNSYGHPHKAVLQLLEEHGIPDSSVYRTDVNGEIDIIVGTIFTGREFSFLWYKRIQV